MSDEERSDSGSEESDLEATGLIATRARRSTAGNLYASLRANLDDEELQKELLAEDEEDAGEYEGSDRDDDEAAFDSSSDDDDAGPPKEGEAEDLSGENEIKRAERAEASKKRKAHDARLKLPAWQNKKKKQVKLADDVKTEDGASERPKKKSERSNWLPTAADAPTRQSDRSLARASRETTHANLKQSYERSEKQRKVMKSAAVRVRTSRRSNVSQEDRLKLAIKIEAQTKKEFNRWEVEEKERQRLRDELLAAKRQRGFEGPFIRHWSGSVIWEGEKIKVARVLPQMEKNKKKLDVVESEDKVVASGDAKTGNTADQTSGPTTSGEAPNAGSISGKIEPSSAVSRSDLVAQEPVCMAIGKSPIPIPELATASQANAVEEPKVSNPEQQQEAAAPSSQPWLEGIHAYASMPPQPQNQQQQQQAPTTNDNEVHSYTPSAPGINVSLTAPTVQPDTVPYQVPQGLLPPPNSGGHPTWQAGPQQVAVQPVPLPPPPPPPIPLIREHARRSLVMLSQFENLESAAPKRSTRSLASALEPSRAATIIIPDAFPAFTAEQAKYLTAKRLKVRGNDAPPKPRCAITSWPAKFRDPKTGLAYADLQVYKIIQRVLAGGCAWSGLLGAWVGPVHGPMGRPAKGVPEAFAGVPEAARGPGPTVKTEDGGA